MHKAKSEIEAIIELIGLRQSDLAARLDVAPGTISRWKTTEQVPSKTWKKLEHLSLNAAKSDSTFNVLKLIPSDVLLEELARRLRSVEP